MTRAILIGRMHRLSLEALATGDYDTVGNAGPFKGRHRRAISRAIMAGLVDRGLASVRFAYYVGATRIPLYVATITPEGRRAIESHAASTCDRST